jgi:peptidoglycan/xylan/chitin deacetylase (PgdA/CDA1 family)
MSRWLVGAFGLLVFLLSAGPALAQADDDSNPMSAAGGPDQSVPLPWTRSIRCPVLYTHEVGSAANFRRLLLGLRAGGFQPTSLASIDAAMSGAAETPPGCLLLTFDDGLYSQYANALPVLNDLGLPGVFFVLPGFADGVHRYMGAAEYRALVDAGEEVEAHTCNHPILPTLARLNLNAFFGELEDCRRLLEGIIGTRVDYLAYPFGAYDATVLDGMRRFNFRAGFSTRAAAILTAASPYTLPRIRYDPAESAAVVIRRIHAAGG